MEILKRWSKSDIDWQYINFKHGDRYFHAQKCYVYSGYEVTIWEYEDEKCEKLKWPEMYKKGFITEIVDYAKDFCRKLDEGSLEIELDKKGCFDISLHFDFSYNSDYDVEKVICAITNDIYHKMSPYGLDMSFINGKVPYEITCLKTIEKEKETTKTN